MMNKTDKQTKKLFRIWLALMLMIISIPVFSGQKARLRVLRGKAVAGKDPVFDSWIKKKNERPLKTGRFLALRYVPEMTKYSSFFRKKKIFFIASGTIFS